jgi:transcriptional regulator with XRE-family HTH domain
MLAPTSATDAGKRLRAARKRLRLSTREVADLSREIALKNNAPDFFISRTWLCRLEAGKLKLNIYRLQSLSLIYRLGLDEILSFFGIDMNDARTEQQLVGLPHTYLVTPTCGFKQLIDLNASGSFLHSADAPAWRKSSKASICPLWAEPSLICL